MYKLNVVKPDLQSLFFKKHIFLNKVKRKLDNLHIYIYYFQLN